MRLFRTKRNSCFSIYITVSLVRWLANSTTFLERRKEQPKWKKERKFPEQKKFQVKWGMLFLVWMIYFCCEVVVSEKCFACLTMGIVCSKDYRHAPLNRPWLLVLFWVVVVEQRVQKLSLGNRWKWWWYVVSMCASRGKIEWDSQEPYARIKICVLT